jgi:hypothetical protein
MTKENSSREFDSKISHATSLQLVDSKPQRRHAEKQNYLVQILHGMTEEDGKWTGWDTGGRTWTSVSAVETFSVKAAVCLEHPSLYIFHDSFMCPIVTVDMVLTPLDRTLAVVKDVQITSSATYRNGIGLRVTNYCFLLPKRAYNASPIAPQ